MKKIWVCALVVVLSASFAFGDVIKEKPREHTAKILVELTRVLGENTDGDKSEKYLGLVDIAEIKNLKSNQKIECSVEFDRYIYKAQFRRGYNGNGIHLEFGQVVKGEKFWGYSSLFVGEIAEEQLSREAYYMGFFVWRPEMYDVDVRVPAFYKTKSELDEFLKRTGQKLFPCQIQTIASP